MSARHFPAFLAQKQVTMGFNLLSPTSTISISLVHELNLPSIFMESGHQSCSTVLIVPTIDGFHRSHSNFVVGCDLFADVVLGNDWATLCQPALSEDSSLIQHPDLFLVAQFPPTHHWYPVTGSIPSILFYLHAQHLCSASGYLSKTLGFRSRSTCCIIIATC